jgi:hypothetical protein
MLKTRAHVRLSLTYINNTAHRVLGIPLHTYVPSSIVITEGVKKQLQRSFVHSKSTGFNWCLCEAACVRVHSRANWNVFENTSLHEKVNTAYVRIKTAIFRGGRPRQNVWFCMCVCVRNENSTRALLYIRSASRTTQHLSLLSPSILHPSYSLPIPDLFHNRWMVRAQPTSSFVSGLLQSYFLFLLLILPLFLPL